MKKTAMKVISVICYFLMLSVAIGYDFSSLLHIKYILLVMAGAAIIAMPFYKEFPQVYGKCAVMAGYILSFLLIFSTLQGGADAQRVLSEIALDLRPILYGGCIYIISIPNRDGEEPGNDSIETKEKNILEFFLEKGLTKREAEVAFGICRGFSNKEIAEELVISETTVKKHISNIFEKLDVKKREDIIVMYKN